MAQTPLTVGRGKCPQTQWGKNGGDERERERYGDEQRVNLLRVSKTFATLHEQTSLSVSQLKLPVLARLFRFIT
jgi:hypothetical protein